MAIGAKSSTRNSALERVRTEPLGNFPPRQSGVTPTYRLDSPRGLDLPPRLAGFTPGVRSVEAGGGASTACRGGKWDNRSREAPSRRSSAPQEAGERGRAAADIKDASRAELLDERRGGLKVTSIGIEGIVDLSQTPIV
jgi:hypothetical protein